MHPAVKFHLSLINLVYSDGWGKYFRFIYIQHLAESATRINSFQTLQSVVMDFLVEFLVS